MPIVLVERKMKSSDFEIINHKKLDHFLYKLCKELVFAQKLKPEYYGWVAAGVLDPRDRFIWAINIPADEGDRLHAEPAAMQKYQKTYGDIPEGSIILTTLSPCNEYMNDREGPSCTDLINESIVRKVYCGFVDPSQEQDTKRFSLQETKNQKIRDICKDFAEQFLGQLDENFADGKGPGHPGDSQHHGIPKGATMAQLQKAAKASGRKEIGRAHV